MISTGFESKQRFFISCTKSRIETNRCFYGCFFLGPFDAGQSLTVANALRRTLLSELRGIAITSVEIEGALHEYSALPGVRDSVLDILLNLKEIVLKKKKYLQFFQTQVGYLRAQGPGIIRAADLHLPPFIQIVDPEQYIATLCEDGVLNMKFFINEGKNYHIQTDLLYSVPVGQIKVLETSTKFYKTCNPLVIDAVFMPVLKVNYIIESHELANDLLDSQPVTKTNSEFSLRKQSSKAGPIKKQHNQNLNTYRPEDRFLSLQEKKSQTKFSRKKNIITDALTKKQRININSANPKIKPYVRDKTHIEFAASFNILDIKTAQAAIDRKQNVFLEIWTNGSIHPRQALYQALKNLLSVFSRLKKVKFRGSMYRSEKNYKTYFKSIKILRKFSKIRF
nr:RNA polymerase alpha subunit [Palmellopsis texensis]